VGSPQPPGARVSDVRQLTQKVAYFITPDKVGENKYVPPAVRFIWGTFQFDGLMDGLEETLEFFSPEGKPLRASLSVTLSQQKIEFAFAQAKPSGPATPGTKQLAQAPADSTVQGLASGTGRDWQSIAAANGIENPRRLAPGTLLDLDASAPQLGAGLGVQAGFAVAPPAASLGVAVAFGAEVSA
jgi:hypothetical protein